MVLMAQSFVRCLLVWVFEIWGRIETCWKTFRQITL